MEYLNFRICTLIIIGVLSYSSAKSQQVIYRSGGGTGSYATTIDPSSNFSPGRLGISVDEPNIDRKFHIRKGVSGTIDYESPFLSRSTGIRIETYAPGILVAEWDLAISNGDFHIYYEDLNSDGPHLSITRTFGFVGIGNETPLGRLDVQSGSISTGMGLNFNDALWVRSNPDYGRHGGIIFHQDRDHVWQTLAQNTGIPDDAYMTYHFTNKTGFSQGSNEFVKGDVFTIQSQGRIGVNKVANSAIIDIEDNGVDRWTQSGWKAAISLPEGGVIIGKSQVAGSNPQNPEYLGFGISSTGWYFAKSANTPGSGTQTGNAKYAFVILEDGKAIAREIEVSLTGGGSSWPDYVFSDEYELKDLGEVDNFIKENGHLPDVPSAEQIETNGLNLGNMDAVLLKKIEELTLYVIDLKKENEEIKEEISNFKNLQNEKL